MCETINMMLGEKNLLTKGHWWDAKENFRIWDEIWDETGIQLHWWHSNSISLSTFRLYQIVKGTSGMLSANGLDQYMIPKYLQIPASTTKWKLDNLSKRLLTFYQDMRLLITINFYQLRPSLCLNTFLREGVSDMCHNWGSCVNSMLHSAQNQVEGAFGRLKVRWAFLK